MALVIVARHTWWRESWRRESRRSAWGSETAHWSLGDWVGLTSIGVSAGYVVDDQLHLLLGDLLIVVLDIAQVVASLVMGLADAHGVMGEVDIAVIAKELRHDGGGSLCLGCRECGPAVDSGEGSVAPARSRDRINSRSDRPVVLPSLTQHQARLPGFTADHVSSRRGEVTMASSAKALKSNMLDFSIHPNLVLS